MKKRNTNWLYIITIVIAAFVFTTTIGFALFNESLTLKGVASTVEYYEGEKLPTTPIILDAGNNRYHTAANVQNSVTFNTESWENDTYTLKYKKNLGMIPGANTTTTFNISFTNPTVLPYTEGEVTTEILENTGNMLKSANTTIDKTIVKPGEAVTVTMTINTNITWRHNTETVKGTVTYNLQNKKRYFYFILSYTT